MTDKQHAKLILLTHVVTSVACAIAGVMAAMALINHDWDRASSLLLAAILMRMFIRD